MQVQHVTDSQLYVKSCSLVLWQQGTTADKILALVSFRQVLWLADNLIATVEGLDKLVKLRELNLACNDIVTIGDALSSNTALQVLNLADNSIGSFKASVCVLALWK